MIQNKLRFATQNNLVTEILIENLQSLADALRELMGNPNADVRKSVVFCMVEIHSVFKDEELFQEVFLDKLNQSQQKLVDIYITRKR